MITGYLNQCQLRDKFGASGAPESHICSVPQRGGRQLGESRGKAVGDLLRRGDPARANPGSTGSRRGRRATRGAGVRSECKICHSLEAGKNMVGPSLHGLIGRKAGSVPGYAYSPAMKNANVTWNDDTLSKYLVDPKAFIPGDKMVFAGIKDPSKLGDLLAYLNQATR